MLIRNLSATARVRVRARFAQLLRAASRIARDGRVTHRSRSRNAFQVLHLDRSIDDLLSIVFRSGNCTSEDASVRRVRPAAVDASGLPGIERQLITVERQLNNDSIITRHSRSAFRSGAKYLSQLRCRLSANREL